MQFRVQCTSCHEWGVFVTGPAMRAAFEDGHWKYDEKTKRVSCTPCQKKKANGHTPPRKSV